MEENDRQLLLKVTRQLRAIRFMLTFFFILFLVMLAIIGFIAYKVVTFTQQVNTKIENIQNSMTEKLDIKSQLCADADANALVRQFCE